MSQTVPSTVARYCLLFAFPANSLRLFSSIFTPRCRDTPKTKLKGLG